MVKLFVILLKMTVLELLQEAIKSQGIDVDYETQQEEHVLLNDAI